MTINKNTKERDSLLDFVSDWLGGTRYFKYLNEEILEKLISLGHADPDDRQNNAPDIQSFLNFMQKFPEVTVHGYVVSKDRPDTRLSIEGAEYRGFASEELVKEFEKHFRDADDYMNKKDSKRIVTLYCWYD